VQKFFPKEAYHFVTSMSPKALAYGKETLKHKALIVVEADGFRKGPDALLLRCLISEGFIHHETADKEGKSLVLHKEGPTGLIVTTTHHRLDAELETRMVSIPINTSKEQAGEIMRAMAANSDGSREDAPIRFAEWHTLQRWIKQKGKSHVVIPSSQALAKLIPPVAVRLRRDANSLMTLIATQAVLHQATREQDAAGRIIATAADYAAVYALVVDLMSEGVGASVSATVRETVEAVRGLLPTNPGGVSVTEIAAKLKLSKPSASDRVGAAIAAGYLVNGQPKRGLEAEISLGDPLPEQVEVLPKPERLFGFTGVVV
jgi:hypothetical protein